MPRPLDGVVVLDLSRLLPGPFCTQLLANLGADVIKVEDPVRGDYMRSVPPVDEVLSYAFLMVNRGKRSVVLDLRKEEGREVLYRLAKQADVFVEQFRPSTVRKLGVDYSRIRKANPDIIYCSFGGFGRTGPYADKPGHDLNFEALAGILAVGAGRSKGEPAIPGVPVSDLASAFMAAFSIVASLHRRERFGGGEFLEVSIFDTTVSLMILNLARYLGTGEVPLPGETIVTGIFPFYNLYETRDRRWISVACVEPKFWRRLCEILDLSEHAEDHYVTGETAQRIIAKLRRAFRSRTLAEWRGIFDGEDLPVMPVLGVDEVVADPHVAARRLLPEVTAGGARRRVLAHPVRASESDIRTRTQAPEQGEHTVEVLRRAGYTTPQIRTLRRQGAIGLTRP